MKKNGFKLLPLILMSPLLMANSPAPMPSSGTYENINVTFVLDKSEGSKKFYDVKVENTGDNFALINYNLRGYISSDYIYTDLVPLLFKSEVVAPSKSVHYSFETESDFDYTDENIEWTTEQYFEKDDDVTFNNITFSEYKDKYYKMSFKTHNLGDYYYSLILELEYDGNTYYIDSHLSRSDTKSAYFETYESLDLSKLKATNVYAFRSNYHTYKGGQILAWIVYGFIGLVAFAILLIPPAIIIPISIVRYKRNKRKNIAK